MATPDNFSAAADGTLNDSKSSTPADSGRTLLIHGYSASGEDFKPWAAALASVGISTVPIVIGNYVTLNNEVTIKDLGEAFDRALRLTEWSSGSKDDSWTFDAVVHSTGMLVLRQWLTSDPFDRDDPRSRIRRLKHLVGLAPATFGSPQGKQGRSWLGALVKGNKSLGPDFLNAGDQVLDGLELASRYTWELAHKDMLCEKPLYDKGSATPYVAIFIGNIGYTGLAAVANSPGTDGTVRWAGCALNSRKIGIDFRREPKLLGPDGTPTRYAISAWESGRLGSPVIAVEGQNHGTIVDTPSDQVAALMGQFFQVADEASYDTWEQNAQAFGADALRKMNAESAINGSVGAGWQQMIVHLVDDHGDGVTDYNLQMYMGDDLSDSDETDAWGNLKARVVPVTVDTYSSDASYRCFYIRLSEEMLALGSTQTKLWLELVASSGSSLIEYEAYTGGPDDPHRLTIDHDGGSPVKLDITALATGADKLLFPYTTTLLEIFIEREPLPLRQVSQLFQFLP